MPKGPRLQENLRKLSTSVQSSKWPVSDGSSMVSTLFVPNKRTFITFLTWGRTCTLLRGRSLSTIQRTEVRFASFFSGWFITVLAVNPPESKLAKCTSVGRIDWGWEGLGDYKSPCLYCSEIKVWMLICTIHKQNIARHATERSHYWVFCHVFTEVITSLESSATTPILHDHWKKEKWPDL